MQRFDQMWIVVASAATVAIEARTSSAQMLDFDSPIFVTTGVGPQEAAIGDLDDDGDPDIVTADYSSSTFSVLVNAGDGTFAAPVGYSVAAGPGAMALGDFDGDGDLDAAVACALGDSLSVRFNLGDGAFGPEQRLPAPRGADEIVVADLDNDGLDDIVVGGYLESHLELYRGVAGGSVAFAQRLNFMGESDLAVGDFDNDGRVDIVAARESDDLINVLFNDGSFSFSIRPMSIASGVLFGVAAADLSGDGVDDLAVRIVDSSPRIEIFTSNGDRTFTTAAGFPFMRGDSGSLEAGDLDNDGHIDIAGASYQEGHITVALNDGSGGLLPGRTFGAGKNPKNVAIGDVDLDGNLDLVAPSSQLSQTDAAILLGFGDGTFSSRVEYPMRLAGQNGTWSVNGVTAADFDGDGNIDIASALSAASDRLGISFGNGDGTLQPVIHTPGFGNNQPTSLTSSDLNGDDHPDLVASIFSPGNGARVFLNDGSGGFQTAGTLYETGGNPSKAAIGDLDGDGDDDIAVSNAALTDSSVRILVGNGAGGFAIGARYQVGLAPSGVAAADFDDDGDLDLAVSHSEESLFIILRNNGIGVFATEMYPAIGAPQGPVIAEDFDLNGDVDLAFSGWFPDDTVKVAFNADGAGSDWSVADLGRFSAEIERADFDNDGDFDIVATDSIRAIFHTWVNDGSGGFLPPQEFSASDGPLEIAPADLNRDGHIDLAIGNFDGESVSVILNRTGGPVSQPAELVDFTIVFGSHISGGLPELTASDDAHLQARSQFGFSAQEPNIIDLVTGFDSPNASPNALDFAIEARLNNPGGNARVRIKNWHSRAFEQVGAFMTQQEDTMHAITNIDPAMRVRASDNRIELSTRISVIATFSAAGFDAWFDRVATEVVTSE